MKKHLHVIGIGGIGVSALARYYKHLGYTVSGSDGSDSAFLDTLKKEGFEIYIGHNASNFPDHTELVIYSEAIITKPDLSPEEQIYNNPELAKARDLGIRHLSYPVALGEVFNAKRGIAITGSHGKSTTTAMTTIMLANDYEGNPTIILPNDGTAFYAPTAPGCSAIIGTQVPQLGNSNFYAEESSYFVIEACEYKRSFLQYHPYITVITNIDLDHLDYYKNLDDYLSAFQSLVDQTSGFVIISADDENSQKLNIPIEKKIIVGKTPLRRRPEQSEVVQSWDGDSQGGLVPEQNPSASYLGTSPSQGSHITYFPRVEEKKDGKIITYYTELYLEIPEIELQVPGDHLLHDSHLAYAVGRLLGMKDDIIVPKLASYKGSWRRSEIIGMTENENILMSDYGHHPNEIRPTLKAIREKYADKRLFVVFQPHQHSRTRELLDDFAVSFEDVDILVIPNIYFSRDKKEDVEWMVTDRLVDAIRSHQPSIMNGNGLENTAQIIQEYDTQNPGSSVILLLGAGDVDSLRYQIL